MEYILSSYITYVLFNLSLGPEGPIVSRRYNERFMQKVVWFITCPWDFIYHQTQLPDLITEGGSLFVGVGGVFMTIILGRVHYFDKTPIPLWFVLPFMGAALGFIFVGIILLKK